MGHPPRIPVWLRWEQRVIYFVTICVANRKPVLANDTAFSAFNTAVAKLQEWTVLAAILMPDHLHAIVSPKDREIKVGNFSGALKRWIRQELGASWKWQPGSFDRLLRSGEFLHGKWLYVQENPVRAGFVKQWREWPYRIGLDGENNCRATASVADYLDGKRSACPTTAKKRTSKPSLHSAQPHP